MATPAQKEKEKRRQIIAVAIVAIIALLGINGYMMYTNSSQGEVIDNLNEEVTVLTTEMDSLMSDYETLTMELENSETENSELSDLVESQKGQLDELKKRFSRMKKRGNVTTAEMTDLRNQLEAMRQERQTLEARINTLTAEVSQLQDDTTKLGEVREQLKERVREEQADKENIKTTLEEQKKQVEDANKKLEDKVARGGVLNVRGINIKTLKVKNSEKEKETSYAKRTDKINICFDVIANSLTKAGNNKFIVRIITPLGETIAVDSKGSGTFANQSEGGSDTRFTMAKTLDYDNGAPNVCLNWNQETVLAKGEYTVEVYNKGYKVGADTFVLK